VKRELVRSASFARSAKRLAKRKPELTDRIRTALTRLAADAFDPRLDTHKLKGRLSERWACSVAYDLRIVFSFSRSEDGEEQILLLSIGSHDEVY
jgi:addiction module RelE/StbE family toxin